MTLTEEILSQLPGNVLGGLRRSDRTLASLRENNASIPIIVKESQQSLGAVDWDVVICGGTLGILIGCALVLKGLRVALIERSILRGREQEWNISRKELEVFLELNLLTERELKQAIATVYNPARVSFQGGTEVWVENVLNIGVDPVYLLNTLKERFLAAGGKLFENTPFTEAVVHPDGVMVDAGSKFKTRLLIDAMGHLSPITQQARQGKNQMLFVWLWEVVRKDFRKMILATCCYHSHPCRINVSTSGKLSRQKMAEPPTCLPTWMHIHNA